MYRDCWHELSTLTHSLSNQASLRLQIVQRVVIDIRLFLALLLRYSLTTRYEACHHSKRGFCLYCPWCGPLPSCAWPSNLVCSWRIPDIWDCLPKACSESCKSPKSLCFNRLFMCQVENENEPEDESFRLFRIKPVTNEPGPQYYDILKDRFVRHA